MKIKLKNNLRVLMESRGVNSWNELSQRLATNQGFEMNRTSISRHGNKENPAYPIDFIEAICNELQCLPDAIFHIDIEDASEQFLEDAQSRIMPFEFGQIRLRKARIERASDVRSERSQVREPSSDDVMIDEMLGPNVTHLDKSKLTKKK